MSASEVARPIPVLNFATKQQSHETRSLSTNIGIRRDRHACRAERSNVRGPSDDSDAARQIHGVVHGKSYPSAKIRSRDFGGKVLRSNFCSPRAP
jgi:hypothetical protein